MESVTPTVVQILDTELQRARKKLERLENHVRTTQVAIKALDTAIVDVQKSPK